MKSSSLGSALVDYIVPTALVGIIVGMGLFAIHKTGAITKFFAASGGMDINGSSASMGEVKASSGLISDSSNNSNESSGDTEETSGNADISCNANKCSIDLGGYTLTGIPENFSDYIEASGSSGGSNLLADLLKQLAEEADISEDEKNLILELANYGHDIASAEKGVEDYYTSNDLENGFIPDEPYQHVNQLNEYITDSSINNFTETLSAVISNLESSSSPDAAQSKEIINVLSSEIIAIANEFNDLTVPLNSGPDFSMTVAEESLALILNPDGSTRTDLDSAVICATGNGTDLGYSCE